MKMHLVALAGLAIGSAVFSGCTNGDFISTSGQQQKTPAKGSYEDGPTFVGLEKRPKISNEILAREARRSRRLWGTLTQQGIKHATS
jgi:hypothetical protein